MSGDADGTLRSNDSACSLRRKIVLPDMNAIRAGGNAKISAIIQDQSNVLRKNAPQLARNAKNLARRGMLLAQLNQCRSSGGNFLCELDDFSKSAFPNSRWNQNGIQTRDRRSIEESQGATLASVKQIFLPQLVSAEGCMKRPESKH